MAWVGNATPRPLYPLEKPGTHCTGGWVGLLAGAENLGPPPTGIRSGIVLVTQRMKAGSPHT